MSKSRRQVPLKTQVERIQSVYERSAARIAGILSGLDPSNFTAIDHGQALRAVQSEVEILNIQVRSWTPAAIGAAYEEGQGVARTRLEIIGAVKSRRYNPARHDRKIAGLVKATLRDFWKANQTIETTARKYLALVSQAAAGVKRVEEMQAFNPDQVKEFIKKTIADALKEQTKYNAGLAHLTSKDITARIREKLLAQLGGEDFIAIRGKDGILRRYNVRSYAETVARTCMRESQTAATIETCKEFDNDLVQFSKHDSPCEKCAQYEGNVYSISGDSPKYPKLPDEAYCPVHPHCEHNLNPTSENALNWRAA